MEAQNLETDRDKTKLRFRGFKPPLKLDHWFGLICLLPKDNAAVFLDFLSFSLIFVIFFFFFLRILG